METGSGMGRRRARGAYLTWVVVLVLLPAIMGPISAPATAAPLASWHLAPVSGATPPGRAQYGMVADAAGTVYVYGGVDGQGEALQDFWSWHPATHAWKQLTNGVVPPLIEAHLAVDAAGNVYEFGGLDHFMGANLTDDGHSYGLYQYNPRYGSWSDLTPPTARQGVNWPPGREDFGFAYDPAGNALWIFAGEGQGNVSLGDMWRYSLQTQRWTHVIPSYAASGGARIDVREIYNISYDGHGGFYLFGGAYVFTAAGVPMPWTYVNDLWRFDIARATWTLLAGQANAYDPTMPIPRHYYGQACDSAGNFYVLGGYVADPANLPFFTDDDTRTDAQVVVFADDEESTGNVFYALSDFWEYSTRDRRWIDQTSRLGDLATGPFIPYVMVPEGGGTSLLTFGGYHLDGNGEMAPSSAIWTYAPTS